MIALAVVAGAFGAVLTGQPLLGLLGTLVVLGSTQEFLLPLHYRLSSSVARVRCGISVTEIEWSKVRRVLVDEAEAKLSPLESETRTAPFRGVTLRFAGNADQVLSAVRERVPSDARFLGGRLDGRGSGGADREDGHGDSAKASGGPGGAVS
ncbi:MAG: hypothetical protein KIS66_12070 [Fimbriimonadaceae bacterium]|nr:hypothetical protein [Fimbriimonadaceae bacterium]